jgi:hypothetical protein
MPSLLHCRLYDLAKSDLKAANTLTNNSHYLQAIYFYAQAFEKAAKSAVALHLTSYEKMSESRVYEELKNNYRHGLLKLTSFTAEIFVNSGIKSHLKRGGKESDKEIQKAKSASSILYLETLKPDMTELLSNYEGSVKACYSLYTKLKEESYFDSEGLKLLRELFKIPEAKYIKFNTLARILFPILDGMDLYSRYPMDDIGNLNIAFLSRPEISGACLLLGEMVGEFDSLVPLVWNKIYSIKTS